MLSSFVSGAAIVIATQNFEPVVQGFVYSLGFNLNSVTESRLKLSEKHTSILSFIRKHMY